MASSQNRSPLSASPSSDDTAVSVSYNPPIPFQQSPPSATAFSEDSEPLRAGHLVLAEGSCLFASSVNLPQITTIMPMPSAGYQSEPLIEQRSSTFNNPSITPAITALPDPPDSSLIHVSFASARGADSSHESFGSRLVPSHLIVYLTNRQSTI